MQLTGAQLKRALYEIIFGMMMYRGGQREVGTWLASKHGALLKAPFVAFGLLAISFIGDVAATEWLWQLANEIWTKRGYIAKNSDWNLVEVWTRASLNSHTAVLQWLITKAAAMRTTDMIVAGLKGAATVGCIDAITLLRPHLSHDAILAVATSAVRCGRLSPLKSLRTLQPPFPLPLSLLVEAAASGRREVVEYLQTPEGGGPHPWTEEIATAAACSGYYELLSWLVKECLCSIDSDACIDQALN